MTVSRLAHIPGIGVDRVGNAADALNNPEMLRFENLDTDIAPPIAAIEATRAAVARDNANSYLPFTGLHELRQAAAARVSATTDVKYDPESECIISSGGLSGVLNTLLALIEPGDEVIITDPAYAGLLNRIRLSGGIPKLVPLVVQDGRWRLDLDALKKAISPKVRAILTMSPSMPSGIVHTHEEWRALCEVAEAADAWIVHDAAMERILFTNESVIHPASFSGMAKRVITIGTVSKEYRMIGWRVGWIVGPRKIMQDITLVSLTNIVCQGGIAMYGAAAALTAEDDGVAAATAEWKARRDHILSSMSGLPVVAPDGGWSLLIDTVALGMQPGEASQRLFDHGAIAATPMTDWGDAAQAGRYLRFVYANEPVPRMTDLRERIRNAWSV
ncbi:pyridoxal phosphate-dependent aminotransferase [Rhizobium sp. CG5]|uniref:pyridoxal phosphate-dependent aminotransferase n=1 Tax=Rhizobium sp. CG5 TaxID=2726076 RepID=UPI0020332C21|nr:pyridoxal phosphate-dependent aminotransferase [Rhizobium sp. CG5]MCM2477741.1 pyridoxal phosphate-dependent aminotransferase [Rhizobium sp. CG5]